MAFHLGRRSNQELIGVHPSLVTVTRRAIELTVQDFTVFDGLRSEEEQHLLVARGASKTLNSKHLQQPDGWGHAVDLVPWINGRARWELEPCLRIAEAVKAAAEEAEVPVRWGGAWARLDGSELSPESLNREYVQRRVAQGRVPFVDAPHYELTID